MKGGRERMEQREAALRAAKGSARQKPFVAPGTVPTELYFNRELSWLEFNRRVLAEAQNSHYPLLERLRFLSISGSNLDEFVMVRIAGLAGQAQRGIEETSIDGRTPALQLAAIRAAVTDLVAAQQASLEELSILLAAQGIRVVAEDEELGKAEAQWIAGYFSEHILPIITPQAIDPAHPFPFIANQGMGIMFSLTRIADSAPMTEMVLIPPALPRFVRLPAEIAGGESVWVSIVELIRRHAAVLFPGFRVHGNGAFRVLRDSDIEIEEDAEDLVRYFRTAIQRRRRGRVILLQVEDSFDPDAEALLRRQLGLETALILRMSGTIDFAGLAAIIEEPRPDLKFEPYSPRYPERILEHDGDCFAAIREKDIVIHHPYESFEVVVDFLRQAAADPEVVAIKQTLYRAGKQSAVIAALIAAAEAGKSVTAVVELKARFDEEQNLLWASQLERAGVQVIYGFVDWKTHAKVSMVVRREGEGYRTYCHFGTGNYHPVTARIYTDLSFFTADPKAGRDVGQLFNFITGYVEPKSTELLAISPLTLRKKLYELIDAEIASARAGKPAMIWAKLNSLTDEALIDRLYAASQAGVDISLVVRGICCLRPGMPGLSERITVKSILGRFLEHSRIWAFGNGAPLPNAKGKVYISSADGMSRNLDRRVELLVPIRNKTVHDQVLDQVMLANLLDTEQSWVLAPDGSYRRLDPGPKPFNLHRYFMTNPSLSGRGAALASGRKVPKLALRRGGGR
ncbi:RNA degradosome polyphosphate kinase [Novosphingobium aerophilum]|uniref:RNA degradosome polyphosphate kinase n=1 Tax=Novosphingobium aerophilum TaxID=2839843 RepID=UPI001FD326CE|nr:RNA degradosome polyphosphate kinase [Novosphingobium aerophilum]